MIPRRPTALLGAAALAAPTGLLLTPPGATATPVPAPLIGGRLTNATVGSPMTVVVGVEHTTPDGDVAVHPLAATSTGDGTFRLHGPLTVPATRNPDGSVLLDVQVTGGGRTKIFNVNALPPDATHRTWRWTSAPDLDLTGGTAAVAGRPIEALSLDLRDATPAPALSTTTSTARPPVVTRAIAARAGTDAGRRRVATATDASMNCNSSTWTNRLPPTTAKRWVPTQRFWLRKHATQAFEWRTSRGTQMQVAYQGPEGGTWAGGFSYSRQRGDETGFRAPVRTAGWRGYVKTRWRFILQDQYCPSTTWPYGAVPSGVHRWYPLNWDGSSLPVENNAVWHCKPGTDAVTRYTSWVAKSSTSRMNGQFSLFGVGLDAMQTNSTESKHVFYPRAGHTFHMCGNTADPPRSKLVKEYVP
jgi:hypothetical protein